MIKLSPKNRTYIEKILKNFKGVEYVDQLEIPYLETILERGTISTKRVTFVGGFTYMNDYNLIRLWIEWYDTYSEQLLAEHNG